MARVLIVDDDPAQRFLFSTLLNRAGFQTVHAENGRNALEVLSTEPGIDVILTDLTMPFVDGDQLVDELQQFYPQIPVIIMSVRAKKDWLSRQQRVSGTPYLQKPFDRDQLVSAVRNAVSGDRVECH